MPQLVDICSLPASHAWQSHGCEGASTFVWLKIVDCLWGDHIVEATPQGLRLSEPAFRRFRLHVEPGICFALVWAGLSGMGLQHRSAASAGFAAHCLLDKRVNSHTVAICQSFAVGGAKLAIVKNGLWSRGRLQNICCD